MSLLWGAVDWYNTLMSQGDRRVQNWFLMQGPGATISICLSYVMFVKVIGPYIMKNRPPLNIRWLMIVYNSAMVVISTYIFMTLGMIGWFGKYNWKCQPVDYSESSDATNMAHLAWWYYVSKFLEFTDTIFFVLRKKFSHISTLHVIHHGIMPMSVWWGLKFTPGGHSTFFAFVNSLVHIVMYFYYALAAVGPVMNKYLWWKKYMTAFQMVQFIAIFVHSFQLLFRECNYPRGFMWWIGFHAILFWFLFAEFYKNAYGRKRTLAVKAHQNGVVSNGKSHVGNGHVSNGGPLTNGSAVPNGSAVSNGSVPNGVSNGVKRYENGYKNGSIPNGYTNGVIHRPKCTKSEEAAD